MQVSINVYDVTNTASENTNGVICRLNSITRELNLGGVFHGAVQIDDVEWSFGYCESGTGVYCCHARNNSLYTFREHIELGVTQKSRQEIREILGRFKRSWPGTSYDLLQRNCCHFCEELCAILEVPRPPAWLNRFAQGADATVKFTNEASALAKRVSSNLSVTAQQSASWLRDLSQRVMSQISSGAPDAAEGPDDDAAASSGGEASISRRGDSGLELSARSDPAGTGGRLASRLKLLAGGASAPSGAPGEGSSASGGVGGLPASTHASTSDLATSQQQQSQSQSSQGLSLPAALRQKWQELEASAGDGTKQFLFGLIKTRQSRLEEDDPAFTSLSTEQPWDFSSSSSSAPGLPAAASAVGPTQATDGRVGANPLVSAPSIQAPPSQVIIHPLRPAEAMERSTAGAAEPAPLLSVLATGPAAMGVAAPAAPVAPLVGTAGAGGSWVQPSVPPAVHLLDM